jgi:hypothetical protein
MLGADRLAVALAGLVVAWGAWGAPLRDSIHSFKLDNGVQVVVAYQDRMPLVSANLTVRVGAVDDPVGQFGIAHILEHATTPGSLRREGYATTLERRGAIGVNAITTWDLTQYFAQFPPEVLPVWLELEGRRLAHPSFRDFRGERAAAVREAVESPDTGSLVPLFREAFPGWGGLHAPYGVPGEMERIDQTAALAFMRSMYRPEKTTVVLVGSIVPEEGRRLCARFLGGWKPSPELAAQTPIVKGAPGPAIVTQVSSRWTAILAGIGRQRASVVESVTFESVAELVNSESLSPFRSGWTGGAWAAFPGHRGPSLFALMLFGPPGVRVDARESLQALLGATDDDLQGAILLTQSKLAEKLETPASLAAALGEYQAVYGDCGRALDEMDAAIRLTPRTLRLELRRLLPESQKTLVLQK